MAAPNLAATLSQQLVQTVLYMYTGAFLRLPVEALLELGGKTMSATHVCAIRGGRCTLGNSP